MNKRIFTRAFTLFSFLLPLSAEASSFTGINIFGDSLVDTGNLFNLTDVPPSPPYFDGRFSNNEIWVDTLANNLKLNPILSSELAMTVGTEGINFAVGGATSGLSNTGSNLLPGLQQQIISFKDLTAIEPADADSLNIIWAGANDYYQAFSDPGSLSVPITDLPEQVTDNLSSAVQSLYDVGARNFLVVNLPDLGETPLADSLDSLSSGVSNQLNTLTQAHNLLLLQKLNSLNTSLSEINLTTLDANSIFQEIISTPSQFGLTNIDSSCLVNFQSGFNFDSVCDNPNEFLFWDHLHGTSTVNQIIAQNALEILDNSASVPFEFSPSLGIVMMGGVFSLSQYAKSRRS